MPTDFRMFRLRHPDGFILASAALFRRSQLAKSPTGRLAANTDSFRYHQLCRAVSLVFGVNHCDAKTIFVV
jgi:hypothetical protein